MRSEKTTDFENVCSKEPAHLEKPVRRVPDGQAHAQEHANQNARPLENDAIRYKKQGAQEKERWTYSLLERCSGFWINPGWQYAHGSRAVARVCMRRRT